MTVKTIIKHPAPILTKVCEPFNPETDQQLIEDLKDTFNSMNALKPIARGLAAPQIGYSKAAFILQIDGAQHPFIFCNPVIEQYSSSTWKREEGCFSFPWLKISIVRPEAIKGSFTTWRGNPETFDLSGWNARGFQHEFDHLQGITIEIRRRMKQFQQ